MWEKINKILKGQIVTSLLYIALGICFILMPVNTVNLICKFLFGIVLILAGVYHILTYVMEKMNATLLDLLSGGLLLVLGVFLFCNPQIIVKLLPVLLGTFVLVDSIWVLKGSFRLKKTGRGEWRLLLIGSILFIGLGIAMIVDPFDMVKYTIIFAGAVMLANGIVDLVFLFVIKRGLKLVDKAKEVEIPDEIVNAAVGAAETIVSEPEYEDWNSRTIPVEEAQILSEEDTERTDSSETENTR